jgi:hypothetical protein
MVGRNPKLKIIQATHTGELAIRFGRKAKNLIDSEDYAKIFKTTLQEDSKAAGRWETAQGGEYFAAGVGGAITGRGADLLIIDDPHSEQDAMSKTALESAYEWYTSGPRQRLQPGGKIVLVMTRWSQKDLTGMLIKNQSEAKADQWHVVEFPAIMDHGTRPKPVWPEYWKLDELEKVQATLPVAKWNAQWMQNPTAEEGAILKREWWRKYTHEEIPELHHVIQSYDTAFLNESGMIWCPEQKFAEEVIEECAAFPYGDHDDLVDSTTQAIMRFRQGGLIGHPEDYVDEKAEKPRRVYY